MPSFKLKSSWVTILQGVEFLIFPLILAWALQQCSATALPVIADADCHNRVKRRCVLETLAAELGTTGIVTDRILIKFTFACADDY